MLTDEAAVTAMLGRRPRGSWSVARRCSCKLPQVIETAPRLEDGTPFPTTYWLTCQKLCRQVGRLEAGGFMVRINERLSSDEDFRARLERSTREYVRRRDRLDVLEDEDHPGGGPRRVKCLHAHVAHQLVTEDNPVGEEVLNELAWQDPLTPCVGNVEMSTP